MAITSSYLHSVLWFAKHFAIYYLISSFKHESEIDTEVIHFVIKNRGINWLHQGCRDSKLWKETKRRIHIFQFIIQCSFDFESSFLSTILFIVMFLNVWLCSVDGLWNQWINFDFYLKKWIECITEYHI